MEPKGLLVECKSCHETFKAPIATTKDSFESPSFVINNIGLQCSKCSHKDTYNKEDMSFPE